MAGWFSICLLAKDSRDFEAIRHELLKQIERYNGMKQDAKINFFENPITRFDIAIGSIGQRKVDVKDYLLETGSLLLFLLLVPALNLLGVTQSAVKNDVRRWECVKHLERLTACWSPDIVREQCDYVDRRSGWSAPFPVAFACLQRFFATKP